MGERGHDPEWQAAQAEALRLVSAKLGGDETALAELDAQFKALFVDALRQLSFLVDALSGVATGAVTLAAKAMDVSPLSVLDSIERVLEAEDGDEPA